MKRLLILTLMSINTMSNMALAQPVIHTPHIVNSSPSIPLQPMPPQRVENTSKIDAETQNNDVDQIWNEMDSDGDGMVSKEEFIAFHHAKPNTTKFHGGPVNSKVNNELIYDATTQDKSMPVPVR